MRAIAILRQLWRLEGTVKRSTYLAAGLIGFAVKYAADWLIAEQFGQTWSPFSYWRLIRFGRPPVTGVSLAMFGALLAASLPFLWFGMAMTLLRLRDAGRSPGWAALFFVPFANVLLFGLLCLMPSREVTKRRDLTGVLENSLFALVASVALGTLAIGLSTHLLASYGVGLFVAVPFSVGYLAALLTRRRDPTAHIHPVLVAALALVLLGGFLLAVAWEGLLCLVMAAPLGFIAAVVGAYLGSRSWLARLPARGNAAACAVILGLPALIVGEATMQPEAPLYRVDTSIMIQAPIDVVWRNVLSFSEITESPEWYFRAGIAYPLRARIDGRGVGAIRYCEFTTGAFVEPIEVWNEPHQLRFTVTSNPQPLRELSPYGAINAPHLDGFLVSHRGQFAMRSAGAGRTELTGSTWYQHHLWPAGYWALWSDEIIHRIHLRVLRHIRALSEQRQPSQQTPSLAPTAAASPFS